MPLTNRLLRMLSDADLAELENNCSTIELLKGDVLARPGDDIRTVYFPHSGIVSFMVQLIDGSIVHTGMVGRDGVVGTAQALDDKKSINKIMVLVPGTASKIDRAPLRELVEAGNAIGRIFASHEQFFVADIQQTAACNASHSADVRLARWLLRMRDLAGDELPMTQDDLASVIGVSRGTVSGIAGAMQDAGAISYARGHLHIENAGSLKTLSCECHRSVRENYQALLGAPWPARRSDA
jgi:CRP-like cAMP-binding protein